MYDPDDLTDEDMRALFWFAIFVIVMGFSLIVGILWLAISLLIT